MTRKRSDGRSTVTKIQSVRNDRLQSQLILVMPQKKLKRKEEIDLARAQTTMRDGEGHGQIQKMI